MHLNPVKARAQLQPNILRKTMFFRLLHQVQGAKGTFLYT